MYATAPLLIIKSVFPGMEIFRILLPKHSEMVSSWRVSTTYKVIIGCSSQQTCTHKKSLEKMWFDWSSCVSLRIPENDNHYKSMITWFPKSSGFYAILGFICCTINIDIEFSEICMVWCDTDVKSSRCKQKYYLCSYNL